jgi:hypothetical protein
VCFGGEVRVLPMVWLVVWMVVVVGDGDAVVMPS